MPKKRSRWKIGLATAFVLFGGIVAMTATALRLRHALEDPHMALALEAVGEPNRLSWLRGRTFLRLGADPDAPILHWGMNFPPLVACVDSGNDALARALVADSGDATRREALARACASPQAHARVLRVLAEHGGMTPEQACRATPP
jgi:hypothetical protein